MLVGAPRQRFRNMIGRVVRPAMASAIATSASVGFTLTSAMLSRP